MSRRRGSDHPMAIPFKYVGRSYPAPDAARKVRGELVYGSDLRLPGMLYAQLC